MWLGKTLLCERPRCRLRKKLVGPFIKLPLKCILREFVCQISGVLQRITSALDWQGWYGQWQKKILGENSFQILAGEQCWGQTTKTLCKLWKQKVNRAFNGCYIHPSESGAKAHSGVLQSKIPKLDLVFNVMIKDSNILNVTLNLADSSTFSYWTECSHPRGKRRAADKSKSGFRWWYKRKSFVLALMLCVRAAVSHDSNRGWSLDGPNGQGRPFGIVTFSHHVTKIIIVTLQHCNIATFF